MPKVAGLRTVVLLSVVGFVAGCSRSPAGGGDVGKHVELLNVSYDPTRELWKDLNTAFRGAYKQKSGMDVLIKTSHAGSSNQARAVIDGLDADVVTLALAYDIDEIAAHGDRLAKNWQARLPQRFAVTFGVLSVAGGCATGQPPGAATSGHGSSMSTMPSPSPSPPCGDGSHESPAPSPSRSLWSGFQYVGQLSSSAPSPSLS